jgi:hypothetical protein
MPSLNISSPGVPTLLTGLSPVAANPIAATGGAPSPAFAATIEGLGFTLDASPPLTLPPTGTNLPPQRPEVAGAPEPLPDIDVEAVMIGATGTVPATPAPAPTASDASEDAPTPEAPSTSADPSIPIDTPNSDPGAIACGLEIWKKGMPRPPHAKVGGPAPLPPMPEETPDLPAVDPALPAAKADKTAAPDPAPAPAADAPAPPPPPAFAPAAWTPPPPQQDPDSPEPDPAAGSAAPAKPAVPQPTVVPQPVPPKPATEAAPSPAQPAAPQPQANLSAPLPNSFTLPPDVAREIAQLVKAATGERDVRDSHDGADSATPSLAAAPPLPQAVSSTQPAPLHPGFAAVHRPIVDTGRAEWMQAMIDRIAEMPQPEGGARDAQIRLVPDALGPVDVKIEQRQDRLHVTLQAETSQARLLLSDAAPKLHELAEARGIRFAHAGFGGADSQDRRQAPDQQPATPSRPRPAASASAPSDSQPDGDLIA